MTSGVLSVPVPIPISAGIAYSTPSTVQRMMLPFGVSACKTRRT